ncbi:MAG: cob(I)yrinic acid a,c-diamide adenosyltransferase [Oligoflexia bacterium]|nr:cob(I)yrinic acid a,c-diamide adenosyltransferase [Oligoflexia bacterium]
MRRIIVITGRGKGKTTSALGVAIRAYGQGLKAVIYQFLKPADAEYGEHIFFRNTGIPVIPLGYSAKKDFVYEDEDIQAAINGLDFIKKDLLPYDLIVLDEVSYPVKWGWISESRVIDLIREFPHKNFVLTGREMPAAFIEIADTVSSVEEIKHIYQEGGKAQKGFEF